MRHETQYSRVFRSIRRLTQGVENQRPLFASVSAALLGAGKTTLTAGTGQDAAPPDVHPVSLHNDIYTQEDAGALMRMQILPQDRVIGVETGGCPHTAIREDASINVAAIAEMRGRHP